MKYTTVVKKLAFYSFLTLIILLSTACPNFLGPVRSFLDEYTNTAAVEDVVYSRELPRDASGTPCLPSNDVCTITFVLRNPQGYALQPSAMLVSGTSLIPEDYTLRLSDDRSSVALEFSKTFLASHEMGGDVSVTLGLFEPNTGRNFPPYTVSLKANTAPPAPRGGRIMATDPGNTYVVCFNLNQEALHKDIASISVNGYSTQVSYASSPLVFSNSKFAISTSGLGEIVQLGSNPAFEALGASYVPVYLITEDPVIVEENKEFLVTITDTAGLSSTFVLNSRADFLNEPKLTDSLGQSVLSGAWLPQDDGKTTATMYIQAPTVTNGGTPVSDVTVYYEVYLDVAYNQLYDSGSTGAASLAVTLPPVPVYVRTWAQKSGYADSTMGLYSLHVTVIRLCVGNAHNSGWELGTETHPYARISDAVSNLHSIANSNNTISLVDDVVGQETILDTNTLRLTLEGNNHELSGDSNNDGAGDVRPLTISAGEITIKNTIITKGFSNDIGGGVYIDGSTNANVKFMNCVITGNKAINGGGGIAVIDYANITIDHCDVSGNYNERASESYGGGLYIYGPNTQVNIKEATFGGNIANGIESGKGGAVYAMGTGVEVIIEASRFENNSASITSSGHGGALAMEGSSNLSLTNSFVIENYASKRDDNLLVGYGGGLHIDNATVLLSGSVNISKNLAQTGSGAGYGGGIYIKSGFFGTNSALVTISENKATISGEGRGGGLYINGGTILLGENNSTCDLSNNIASESGDGYGGGLAICTGAVVTLTDTAITNNKGSDTSASYGGGIWAGTGFTVKGNTRVPADGELKNDVFLVVTDSGPPVALAQITIGSTLGPDSSFFITPGKYEVGAQVLAGDYILEEFEKFTVKKDPEEIKWKIDSTGKLQLE